MPTNLNSQNPGSQTFPRFVAFDLEIARVLPGDFSLWRRYRPLGITCAALYFEGAGEPELWYSQGEGGGYAPQMSRADAARLVAHLEQAVAQGWQIVTWNGLAFDFDVLAEESGCREACKELALGHVDMMFHFFCLQGYRLALDAAARGMGLPGKTVGMSGELAPKYWQQGRQAEVLAYVAQDVRTTLDLASRAARARRLAWISKAGRPQQALLTHGWLSVHQALKLPLPDTAWMVNPTRREEFMAWMEEN